MAQIQAIHRYSNIDAIAAPASERAMVDRLDEVCSALLI
jgi:hypothetical protein